MPSRVALILADADDVSSDLVGAGLVARGYPVLRAGSATLAGSRWWHSPDGAGTRLELPDGTGIDDGRIGIVLNRLDTLVLPRFATAAAEDRDYAVAEFAALLASWLGGLSVPVANPPGGEQAWAVSLHPLGWHALAVQHGLAVGDFVVASSVRGGACAGLQRLGDNGFPRGSDVAGWYRARSEAGRLRVWVFGAACVGTDDPALTAACSTFVAALGLRYAALGFDWADEGWRLVDVSPRPPLDAPPVAAACIDWLEAAL